MRHAKSEGTPTRWQIFRTRKGKRRYWLSLTDRADRPYWLENELGEGMSISENDLWEALNKIWKDGF